MVKGLYVSHSLQGVWIVLGKFVQVGGQLDAVQCHSGHTYPSQRQPIRSGASRPSATATVKYLLANCGPLRDLRDHTVLQLDSFQHTRNQTWLWKAGPRDRSLFIQHIATGLVPCILSRLLTLTVLLALSWVRTSLSGGTGRKGREIWAVLRLRRRLSRSMCRSVWTTEEKVRGALRLTEAVKTKPVHRDVDILFLRPKRTTCPCYRLCKQMLPLDSLVHDAYVG